MKKLSLLLAAIMVMLSLPAAAETGVFAYSQNFDVAPEDGIFTSDFGYSYYESGAYKTKIYEKDQGENSNMWRGPAVFVNGAESDRIYLQAEANVPWNTSFKLSTVNVGSENDSSYILFDGPNSKIFDSKGRWLDNYTTGKPTNIQKIGLLIDKTEQKADLYVNNALIAVDIEWKLGSLGKVSYKWYANDVDTRPSIDNIVVTCDTSKMPENIAAIDADISVHTAESSSSADNGLITRILGNIYAHTSGLLYNQAWSDQNEYGSMINVDGKVSRYFYLSISPTLPTNTIFKLKTKNLFDVDFTEEIDFDATKTENNITLKDGSVIGSYDFSNDDTPQIEVMIDQQTNTAGLWISNKKIASDFKLDISNLGKIGYMWKIMDTSSTRSDKNIGKLIVSGNAGKLPMLSYSQDFDCAEMPVDEYFSYDGICSLENGAFISTVPPLDENGAGISINTSRGFGKDYYIVVDTVFEQGAGLKIISAISGIENTLVYFNGNDGKIYNKNNAVIGEFNNSSSSVQRKIEIFMSDDKAALVIDGELITIDLPRDVKTPDYIAIKWVNSSAEEIHTKIENIFVTEKENEYARICIMKDLYIIDNNVVLDVLNTSDSQNQTALIIKASYTDGALQSADIENITMPEEMIGSINLGNMQKDTAIFVWQNMSDIKPLSTAIKF